VDERPSGLYRQNPNIVCNTLEVIKNEGVSGQFSQELQCLLEKPYRNQRGVPAAMAGKACNLSVHPQTGCCLGYSPHFALHPLACLPLYDASWG
jgi:hypothetical protein